jgi:hypothetical protein
VELAARARQQLGGCGVEVLAGGEVELAVVAEVYGAAVMLGAGVLRVLVQHDLTAGDRPGVGGVCREPRQPVTVRGRRRVEDVVEVVVGEIRVQDDVVDPLLDAGGPDVGELQEQRRVRSGVRRGQDLDPPLEFDHQHAAVGEELEVRGQVEPGGEDLVLEAVVDVGDVDRHRR